MGSIFFPSLQRVGSVVRLSSLQVRHELVDRVLSCVCIFARSISPRTCKQKVHSGCRFGLFCNWPFIDNHWCDLFYFFPDGFEGSCSAFLVVSAISASSVQNLHFRSEVVFLNDTIDGKMLYHTIALTDFNLRLFFMYRHVCDAD